ncbi:hypothetical protein FPRO04_05759 [Fusarium proliferatum]|nr:hypothetical protein FPRO04_05759 [Fusarium proliferatum]
MLSYNEKRVQGIEICRLTRTRQMPSINWWPCFTSAVTRAVDTSKEVIRENERLKRNKAKLRTACDTNIEAVSRYQTEFERQKADFEKQLGSQEAQNEAILKGKQAADEHF